MDGTVLRLPIPPRLLSVENLGYEGFCTHLHTEAQPMDEEGASSLCDFVPRSASGTSRPDSPLPMYLIMVHGGIPGAMLRLSAGGTRLGRALDNTYPLAEGSVSRYHALFAVDPQGVV